MTEKSDAVKKRVNLHIYASAFNFDSRLIKETKSIISLGLADEIVIASRWEKGLKKHEEIDRERSVRRFPLWAQKLRKSDLSDGLKYIEFNVKIVFSFLFKKIDIINCHSLVVLPIGVFFKIFKKNKLIYDAHELETERNGMSEKGKKVTKWIEKQLIPYVDELIVVSNSIAKWYKTTYHLDHVSVVRNIPVRMKLEDFRSTVLRDHFNLHTNEIAFMYQGLITKGRGIDICLEAFAEADPDKHIIFMGFGDTQKIKDFELRYLNIHFFPAVKPNEILRYTSSVDIGISLIENTCLSYYYCLPNKFFEYMSSGIPVIASNFPDMTEIFTLYPAGWTINPSTSDLRKLISLITPEEVLEKKAYLKLNHDVLPFWDNEQEVYKEVFKNF